MSTLTPIYHGYYNITCCIIQNSLAPAHNFPLQGPGLSNGALALPSRLHRLPALKK